MKITTTHGTYTLRGLTCDAPAYLIERAIEVELAPSNEVHIHKMWIENGVKKFEVRFYSENVEDLDKEPFLAETYVIEE